ncbi:MAG: TonB-dependent receptor, partial [Pyrinomonadaceae bacterium]|nr:TonB-dependent receptor [Pyrinomonadaceae bacterium]
YNENLILSSAPSELRGSGGILGATTDDPLLIGRRNQFNVGLQQQFGKYILVDADYFWKYTRNAYDFNVILNTPITFPIAWEKSELDGLSLRINLANFKGLSAFYVAGTSRARFFPPETGGLFFVDAIPNGVFRIDHEQKFQHSFQVQYQMSQIKGLAPYFLFGWKYDSGLVAGEPQTFDDALALTPNQQAQIGLFCGNQIATRANPIANCNSNNRGALRVRIPVGEQNDDHNPIRIAPRNIFNFGIGTDNLLRSDVYKMNLRFNVLNLTDKQALYNFLSPFGGTHFVAPRTIQLQAGIRF